jgi:hypothetical protein
VGQERRQVFWVRTQIRNVHLGRLTRSAAVGGKAQYAGDVGRFHCPDLTRSVDGVRVIHRKIQVVFERVRARARSRT